MKFSLKIEGRLERIVVCEGDVIVFPGGFGESHFAYDGSNFSILVVGVAPERVRVSNQPLPHVALKPQIGISDAHIARMLSNMRDEVAAGCPSGTLYGQTLSLALAAYLEGRFAFSPRQSKSPGRFSPAEVRRLGEYIRANLGSDVNLSDLADLVGMSSRTFSRVFSRTFRSTPHRYVLVQRMDQAKTLLIGGKAVAEVANAVGLAPGYFSTAFRKAFGTSPSQLRSEHRSCIRCAPLASRIGERRKIGML